MRFKKLLFSNKKPSANSIPINIREKKGATFSEKPKVYNCFTSKVEIAKYGDGYSFAAAESMNKKAIKNLIVHGRYFFKMFKYINF